MAYTGIPLKKQTLLWLFFLSAILCLLNAFKPLTVDDAAYYYYAKQITRDFFHPYAFRIFWYQDYQPANSVLAPPVLPYWWALGIRLFGEQPFLWKVWLFPFAYLFTWAFHSLARRFAQGLEIPLVAMAVLSPVILPSFNLMLDVPAASLGLGALEVFFRSCRNRSWLCAFFAGVLAGLAMETKYAAFTVPIAILLYGMLFHRFKYAVLTVFVAGAFFFSWEVVLAYQHGQSHFIQNLFGQGGSLEGISFQRMTLALRQKLILIDAVLTQLGGLCPALLLLVIIGFRVRFFWIWILALVTVLFYSQVLMTNVLTTEPFTFGILGLWLVGLGSLAIFKTYRKPTPYFLGLDRFLVLWLGVEGAAYFLISPFPAARRMIGLCLVCTLLGGRWVHRLMKDSRWTEFKLWVTGLAAGNALLGFLYFAVDYQGATALKQAAESSAKFVQTWSDKKHAKFGKVWFTGHWGFQFYSEKNGMQALAPKSTRLKEGDWIVMPDSRVNAQYFQPDRFNLTKVAEILSKEDPLPLTTLSNFYSGNLPLEHRAGPRLSVSLYRVDKTPSLLPK